MVLDVEMPERNGPATAAWIRNYELTKQRRNVPIIGLTGHDSADIKEMCISAGMNQVLTKPIKKADALSVLDALIM